MKLFLPFLILCLSNITNAQDCYISYDKTYSIDTIEINNRTTKRMRSMLNSALKSSNDELKKIQIENQINMFRNVLYAMINENKKYIRKDIKIENDTITIIDVIKSAEHNKHIKKKNLS